MYPYGQAMVPEKTVDTLQLLVLIGGVELEHEEPLHGGVPGPPPPGPPGCD